MPKKHRKFSTKRFLSHPHHVLFISLGIFGSILLFANNGGFTYARELMNTRGESEQHRNENSNKNDASGGGDSDSQKSEVKKEEEKKRKEQRTMGGTSSSNPNSVVNTSAQENQEKREDTNRNEVEDEVEDETEDDDSKLPDQNEKIQIRERDGAKKVDVTSGNVRVRLQEQNGQTQVTAETKNGSVELEKKALDQVRERLNQTNLKFSTDKNGKSKIEQSGKGAQTDLPVFVDLSNNELSVETPEGQKKLKVLPDQAALGLYKAGYTEFKPDIFSAINPASALELKQLTTGELVYETETEDSKKVLGVFPVKIPTKIQISADTGDLLSVEKTTRVGKILSILSF